METVVGNFDGTYKLFQANKIIISTLPYLGTGMASVIHLMTISMVTIKNFMIVIY